MLTTVDADLRAEPQGTLTPGSSLIAPCLQASRMRSLQTTTHQAVHDGGQLWWRLGGFVGRLDAAASHPGVLSKRVQIRGS